MRKINYITNFISIVTIVIGLVSIISLFYINFYMIIFIIIIALILILTSFILKKIYNHNPTINDYMFKNQEKLKETLRNTIDIANTYQDDFNKFGYRISFDIYYQKDNKNMLKVLSKNYKNLYQPVIVYGIHELKDVFYTQIILYDKIGPEIEINKMQNKYSNNETLKNDLIKWLDVFSKVEKGSHTIFKEYYEIPFRLWKNIKYIPSTWKMPYYILTDNKGNNEFKIKYYGEIIFTNNKYQLYPVDDLIKIEASNNSSNTLLIADNTIDTEIPVKKVSPEAKNIFKCHKCHNEIFKIKLEYYQPEEQDINEEKAKAIAIDEKIISQCYYTVVVTANCTNCNKKHNIIYKL